MRKPLWFDELFTYYVASQPGPVAIGQALLRGADNHPPLDYIVRHYALYLPGPVEVTFRLPSVVAFVGFCSCVFLFVHRCAGLIAGLTAFAIPIATSAYKHAPEARDYPLLLLCTGLSMVAWQAVADECRHRWLWAAVLAVSLGVGLNAHYYGILLLAAFYSAEAFRWWYTRRFSRAAVVALFAAVPAVIPLLPFAREASKFAGNFWTPLTANALPTAYSTLLGGATLLVVLVAGILAVGSRDRAVRSDQEPDNRNVFSAVLSVCLVSTVVLSFVMALFVTKAFLYRYAIVAVAGVAALLPLVVARHAGTPVNRAILLAASVALAALHAGYQLRPSSWWDGSLATMRANLSSVTNSVEGPIVWGDMMECFALTHYFRDIAGGRVHCVAGPAERETLDRAAQGLRPFTSLPIRDAAEWFRTVPAFSVVHPAKFGYGDQLQCDIMRRATGTALPVARCSVRTAAER